MDNTHSTNIYDFMLVTVLIIDEYGEGAPVAWALSNRFDTALITNFKRHSRLLLDASQQNFLC